MQFAAAGRRNPLSTWLRRRFRGALGERGTLTLLLAIAKHGGEDGEELTVVAVLEDV